MGKMKQKFAEMQQETINAMHDIAQQPSINQLNNNNMTKKTMQEKLRKQPEPVQETRKEALNKAL